MSNLGTYGTYNPDTLDQEDTKIGEITNNAFIELQDGDNVLRFLPPGPDETSPFRITAIHYVDQIPGMSKKAIFNCPRIELSQPCPACAEAERLSKTGKPQDRERARDIAGKLRIYANVVDRGHPEKMIREDLKKLRKSVRAGGDFTDPTENGFDVVVTRIRTGTGAQDVKYSVAADRNNSPLAPTPAEIDAICIKRHNLSQFVNTEVAQEVSLFFQSQSHGPGLGRGGPAPMRAPVQQMAAPAQRMPPAPTGPRPGAAAMPARRSAVQDAEFVDAPAETDDDFPAR